MYIQYIPSVVQGVVLAAEAYTLLTQKRFENVLKTL